MPRGPNPLRGFERFKKFWDVQFPIRFGSIQNLLTPHIQTGDVPAPPTVFYFGQVLIEKELLDLGKQFLRTVV